MNVSKLFFFLILFSIDRGFDFDGAAGHDSLVTDNLLKALQSAVVNQLFEGPQIFNLKLGTSMHSKDTPLKKSYTENEVNKS